MAFNLRNVEIAQIYQPLSMTSPADATLSLSSLATVLPSDVAVIKQGEIIEKQVNTLQNVLMAAGGTNLLLFLYGRVLMFRFVE